MRFNANTDNFTQIAASESLSALERSKREVPLELKSEGLSNPGRDLCWSETRAMPELDARTRYDIGENDCRPPQAKPTKAYSASFEAMLNRSI